MVFKSLITQMVLKRVQLKTVNKAELVAWSMVLATTSSLGTQLGAFIQFIHPWRLTVSLNCSKLS